ncbi:putative TIM-barrel fold metal-dependent hydrolase [Rhodobium orientis]|uniref:Amidohydrolase n=1 Tax=Rhodobium orientis TaxID=34017 RepID=A0A327JQE8_9HYPH|nr:amidohydrolase family protein [Rhodobium orientis]MBB4301378.1 putative TIM-barrel fold metal-dependent hydrolase [Rhodobium orientis]MBK5951035.1 amidohydrolase [Rhodobium orientis]RAI27603.1 amidohydrolase [Rhodobium orientis]
MTLPIVDAHHHVWRLADQPWLQGPSVPRIFGEYDPIKRDYPMAEYLGDIEGSNVVKSVYVQTNWARERAVEEVEWVQSIADETGWPHGIVGFVDFFADTAFETLQQHARAPLMRGVRQQLHWHENPQYRFASGPNEMASETFRANLARLPEFGWLFELQVFAPQMADAADLVRAFPQITFVLEHAGMLEDTSDKGRADWREGMKRLAEHPNVHTKLSGLGTFVHQNDPEHIARIFADTVEIFGAERCVWGSNFPIEKLWTDYASLADAARAAVAGLPEASARAILHDNAVKLYGLDSAG